MNNFTKIGNFDASPILRNLEKKPQLWNAIPLRTTAKGSVHTEVSDILLRFNDLASEDILNDLENQYYPAYDELPAVKPIIFGLMNYVEGTRLGRVFISKLPAGKTIPTHTDEGEAANYYDRFHLIIKNEAGSVFNCGDESICMKSGDIYKVNNNVPHSVINNSRGDRISLVVDIRTE